MKTSIFLAAMLMAGTAHAVAPVAAPTPSATQPQPAAAARKIPGVSDEGNAILAKAQAAPDPQLQSLAKQLKAARDQMMSAAMAPVIDPDKVAAAMKAENDAQGEIRDHASERLLAVLKQLPSEDRGTFLRTLIMSRQQRPAGQAAATPPATNPKP